MKKIQAGDVIGKRQLVTIHESQVQVPDPTRLVHLQFRRFAGCPFCNLHMSKFAQRSNEIAAAGVMEVVVFHSSVASMLPFQGGLPFAVVADPGKKLYSEFGVEQSPRALLDPRAWLAGFRGAFHVRSANPEKGESPLGLPADFLIAPDGRVLACKYGVYAYDQWPVDTLLALARQYRDSTSRPAILTSASS